MISAQEHDFEASKRYLTDPEFHARTKIAIQVAAIVAKGQLGRELADVEVSLIACAAANALLASELDVTEILGDQEEAMRREAAALGFDLLKVGDLGEAPQA